MVYIWTFSQNRRCWRLNLCSAALHTSQICGCKMYQRFCSKSQALILQNIHQLYKQRSIYLGSIMLWKLKKKNAWTDISRVHHFWSLIKKPKTQKILPILLLIIVLKKKPSRTSPKHLYSLVPHCFPFLSQASKTPVP